MPEHADRTSGVDPELADQIAGVARLLLAPGSPEAVETRVEVLWSHALDNSDEAGLCALPEGPVRPHTQTAGAAELDALQRELQQGPCVEVQLGDAVVYSGDVAGDQRWPAFGPAAAERGLHSALALPLFAGTHLTGALHTYSRTADAFDAPARARGLIFAALAGLAVEIAHKHQDEADTTRHLQVALESRELIGQAQGILMERERVTAEEAFTLLRRCSQELNIKLRTVAQEFVDTGALPTRTSSQPPAAGRRSPG